MPMDILTGGTTPCGKQPMIIILTDLDGTLLDSETYSCHAASEALQAVADLRIPLVIMSSKTRSEIESVRRDLGNPHPFASENGGGLFVPEGYFPFPTPYTRRVEGCLVVDIGVSYTRLTVFLEGIVRDHSLPVRGFHSLSVEAVARLAGLPLESAARAKDREYDEPFLFDGNEEQWGLLEEMTATEGLTLTRGGRFHHLSGPHDKGTAARMLVEWYRWWYPDALIVGLGDAPNDLPFLKVVDCPVVVQRPGGIVEMGEDLPELSHTSRPGPAGWNEAVLELIRKGTSI